MENKAFEHDVFIAYSSADGLIAQDLARRLTSDGLKVWIDSKMLLSGMPIAMQVDRGLENSRALVLCMSKSAFGKEWRRLEAETFRFRDPLNKGRRFVPLRLDDADIPNPLDQVSYVDWRKKGELSNYSQLLDACTPPKGPNVLNSTDL